MLTYFFFVFFGMSVLSSGKWFDIFFNRTFVFYPAHTLRPICANHPPSTSATNDLSSPLSPLLLRFFGNIRKWHPHRVSHHFSLQSYVIWVRLLTPDLRHQQPLSASERPRRDSRTEMVSSEDSLLLASLPFCHRSGFSIVHELVLLI
jgi:hypothetical protein